MADPIVLIRADDPERKPVSYACPKCGRMQSPSIYLTHGEAAHAAARAAAADCYDCKTHNSCADCGAQCHKYHTLCPPCRRKRAIASASTISADEIEHCFGLDNDEFYETPKEAAEDGEEWVFAANFRPFRVPDGLIDAILEDHHEDASAYDLVGVDALEAAVAAFDEAQTSGSYEVDRKRIAYVRNLVLDGHELDAASGEAAP